MVKTIAQNGKSFTVSLNPYQLEQLGWSKGDKVDVVVKGKEMVLRKVKK